MRAPTGPEERGRTTYSSRRQSGPPATGSFPAQRLEDAVPGKGSPPRPLSVRSTPRPRRAPSGPGLQRHTAGGAGGLQPSPGPPSLRPQRADSASGPPCPGSGSRAAPALRLRASSSGAWGKGRLRTAPLQPSSILSTGRRPAGARDSSGRQRKKLQVRLGAGRGGKPEGARTGIRRAGSRNGAGEGAKADCRSADGAGLQKK